ncbi:MAG: SBBP repeat-containing protein [Dehalococcoidia bacterium]|nr:SBBP repeat-containing protein [Dehalococcoidia bacterium]
MMKLRLSALAGVVLVALMIGLLVTSKVPAVTESRSLSPGEASPAPTAERLTSPGGMPMMFVENAGQFAESVRFQALSGDRMVAFGSEGIRVSIQEKARNSGGEPLPLLEKMLVQASGSVAPYDLRHVNLGLTFVGANSEAQIEPFDRLDTHISYFLGSDPAKWRSDVPVWGGLRYREIYDGINLEVTGQSGRTIMRLRAAPWANVAEVRLRVDGAEGLSVDGDRLSISTPLGEYDLPLLQVVTEDGTTIRPLGAPEVRGNEIYGPFITDGAVVNGLSEAAGITGGSADLIYARILGGSSDDRGHGIAVDDRGYAYITGVTASNNFVGGVTPGYDTSFGGNTDAFVVKLDREGTSLVYATFLGGISFDAGKGIAVDKYDNAYIAGATMSADFPAAGGPGYDNSNNGAVDAFVVKLNATGTSLVYATFLGGDSGDQATGIALDGSGNAFVVGFTASHNFPAALGPGYDTSYNTGSDAFIVKLNQEGTSLVYATFLGGSGMDFGGGIAVDSAGNAYVTGVTSSSDFPVTGAQGFDASYNLADDAFVVKINAAGSARVYSTFLGGSNNDSGSGIAVDEDGNAWVVGSTLSTDFPVTTGGPIFMRDPRCNSDPCTYEGDAFVVKFNGFGTSQLYATYWGRNRADGAGGIAVDSMGNAYVAGSSQKDFCGLPWRDGLPATPPCENDVFVAIFNTGGGVARTSYWATEEAESASSIAFGGAASAYVTGETTSAPLSGSGGAGYSTSQADTNAFVLRYGYSDYFDLEPRKLETYANPGGKITYIKTLTLTEHSLSLSSINWHAVASTVNGEGWLSVSPTDGTIAPNQSLTLAVTIDSRQLTTGSYEGEIRVSSSSGNPSPVSASVRITNMDRPLMFIPGTMGSTIINPNTNDQLWPSSLGLFHEWLTLFPDVDHPNLVAGDVYRTFWYYDFYYTNIYTTVLLWLSYDNYKEYQVDNRAERRTENGCDVANQRGDNPNLFVFAYDFRLSIDVSAQSLKDYVGCIERFYPGTQINVLTHSMGGLVARRYILANPRDNRIDNLITEAAPWLGAPTGIKTFETGDFVSIIDKKTMRNLLAPSWTGPAQLLPSAAFFLLGWKPMGEAGVDFNNSGNPYKTEFYDYYKYIELLDDRYGHSPTGLHFNPGTATKSFHDYVGPLGSQDDWSGDQTGVNYFHIIGHQGVDTTIGKVVMTVKPIVESSYFGYITTTKMVVVPELIYVAGDGTVPLLSAQRIVTDALGKRTDYNAPGAVLTVFTNAMDSMVEHNGMNKNPYVYDRILDILKQSNRPNSKWSSNIDALRPSAAEPVVAPTPAYYLSTVGGVNTVVTDSLGNSTALITGTLRGEVPGVTSYRLAEDIEDTILSGGGEYTVTFAVSTGPLVIELNYGAVQTPTQVVRYLDLSLPVSRTAMLRLGTGGIANLRYDGDLDGVFETVVTPTVNVSGSAPLDVQPPLVNFTASWQAPSVVVTVTATDSQSGVAALYYSIDGSHFRAYTSTLVLSPTQTPVVYAFADDNLANRSSLSTYALARLRCCDYNGNGKVDIGDLQTIGKQWGAAVPTYDFGGDGSVDLSDLNYAALHWHEGQALPQGSVSPTVTLGLLLPRGIQPLSATVDVPLVITGAANLGAFEFSMEFDRSGLQVVSMTINSLLGKSESCNASADRCVLAVGPEIGALTTSIGAFTYGAGSGVTGNGELAVIRLQKIGSAGPVFLRVSNALIADTAGNLTTPMTSGSIEPRRVYLPLITRNWP